MRTLLVLLAILTTAGCENPLRSVGTVPPGAIPLDPHPAYRIWYAQVEADAGIPGDFDRIRWFEVTGGPWPHETEPGTVTGRWMRDHRIYIARGYTNVDAVVYHEMLHDVLRGDPNHKHPLFATDAYNNAPWWLR